MDLIKTARDIAVPNKLSMEATSGDVGAALVSDNGEVYTGVSLNAACGIGACAEYGAIIQMLKDGRSEIKKIVAVNSLGNIMPPCGRCRELMYQINRNNLNTKIILSEENETTLKSLLDPRWQDVYEVDK
ncbi:MAG: cytidine deaminase [Candidatus Colwellbacteria bacterium]|nr:cytidine deaminase [Candidatus Colwellbacteria bacterium]